MARRSNPVTDGIDLTSAAAGAAVGFGLAWLLKPAATTPAHAALPGWRTRLGEIAPDPRNDASIVTRISVENRGLCLQVTPTQYQEGVTYYDSPCSMWFSMRGGRVYTTTGGTAPWRDVTGTTEDPTRGQATTIPGYAVTNQGYQESAPASSKFAQRVGSGKVTGSR